MNDRELPPSLKRIGHEIGEDSARKLRDPFFSIPSQPRMCRIYVPKSRASEKLISRVGVKTFARMQKRWGGQYLVWSMGRNIDRKRNRAKKNKKEQ